MQMNERNAGISGIVAVVMFWASLFAFAAVRPEYTHFHKAISELGVVGAPNAIAWNLVGFIIPGLLLALCGSGLAYAIDGRISILWLLLVVSGLGFAGTGVLPAEMRDGSFEMESPLTAGHIIMTFVSAVPWLCAALLIIRRTRKNSQWSKFRRICIFVAIVSLLFNSANILSGAIPLLEGRPALGQRIAFAGYFGWYLVMSLLLLRATPRQERQTAGLPS